MRGTETVLTAAAAAGVRRVILRSSAMVYGALPDNPVPLPDSAQLRAVPDGSLVADLLEIESLAAAPPARTPACTTVLRPAIVTGPGVDTVFTRHFEARLLVVKDTEPCWQFCHPRTWPERWRTWPCTRSIEAPTTWRALAADQEQVEVGSRVAPMPPAGLALGAAERLHRLHLTPAPATDLQYVMHPWAVSAGRPRPASNRSTGTRRPSRRCSTRWPATTPRWPGASVKDAAASLGAAGATVALVGTAALVRRARKKRRG